MFIDATTAGVLIVGIVAIFGILAYRLNRKKELSEINVEWKTPFNVSAKFYGTERVDLYFFVEAIFTNTGDKSVSAVELVQGKGGFFSKKKFIYGEPIKNIAYEPPPDVFILNNPIHHYLNEENLFMIKSETKLKPLSEIPLGIPINPGKSERLSICFYIKDYQKLTFSDNHIVSLKVKFNNKQTSSYTIADGGFISFGNKKDRIALV